jgi:hypothetical protein
MALDLRLPIFGSNAGIQARHEVGLARAITSMPTGGNPRPATEPWHEAPRLKLHPRRSSFGAEVRRTSCFESRAKCFDVSVEHLSEARDPPSEVPVRWAQDEGLRTTYSEVRGTIKWPRTLRHHVLTCHASSDADYAPGFST